MTETVFDPFASQEISEPYSAEWASRRKLVQALRDLIELSVTSTPSIEKMDGFTEVLQGFATELADSPRLFGRLDFEADGSHGSIGEVSHELNALGGVSNPLSPGLNMWVDGEVAHASVSFGWAYEGPPGHVHGGFVAAIFDQFLGMAQTLGKNPGMTGTLGVRYMRPTPLNTELKLEARITRQEGRKTTMVAEMRADGEITASCEALFIRPLAGMPMPRKP